MTRLVRTPYITSGDFPELPTTAPHGLWSYLSEKVFFAGLSSRLIHPVKWKTGQKRLERLSYSFGDCRFTIIKLPTFVRFIWAVCLHLRAGYQPIPISFFIFAGRSRNVPCYPGATRTHARGRNRTSGVNGYKPYPFTTWVLSLNRH